MLNKKSRIDEARNDTLINKAPFDTLSNLSLLYGLGWMNNDNITDDAQRAFLQATLYGVRGTYTGFFSSVRALFSYGEVSLNNITLASGLNNAYIQGTNLAESWGLNRFIEITKNDGTTILTRSTHSQMVGSITTGFETRVYLSAVSTASHTEEGPNTQSTKSETVSVNLLPFRLLEPQPAQRGVSSNEKPCEVILELFETILSEVPPSYYRENGDARTLDPQGLQMMSLNSTPPLANRLNGPFPLYYDQGDALSEFIRSLLDKLLASGIELRATRRRLE